MFINSDSLKDGSWQSFERAVSRLLLYEGYSSIRIVGQSSDRGADIIASKFNKRWLFQIKHWKQRVGLDVVDRTLESLRFYRAQIPVIVALNGFDNDTKDHQRRLLSQDIPLQLWDGGSLINRVKKLNINPSNVLTPRPYQESIIKILVQKYIDGIDKSGLVVLATGLGKTFVAAETIRRINATRPIKILVLAHTNEIVYQLERSFWPFLSVDQETLIWNGYERPNTSDIERASFVFGCLNSVAEFLDRGGELPNFDIIIVDECHHVGGQMYLSILEKTHAGTQWGPFLIGLTATPWRPDETNLHQYFGEPLITIDILYGLKNGFLSNVDYRMYTDNINWDAIKNLKGKRFSPKKINRTLFINQWDDGVVIELQKVWKDVPNPRVIVFCGTIDHAITMRDRINSYGFCNAAALYSQTEAGRDQSAFERNRILCDFSDGIVNAICVVDIFNEGIDVPDVNIIVFQRVTHSRRIFIQQLGRGLRISEGKEKVTVLDFVSDIRRFAAGISLKDGLQDNENLPKHPVRINLPHKVTFRKVGGEDPETETYLRHWLEDITAIEDAGEDVSILKYPPPFKGK